jgi:hypothetical protein
VPAAKPLKLSGGSKGVKSDVRSDIDKDVAASQLSPD